MSDVPPAADSNKTPPPENNKPAVDNTKATDNTHGTNDAGKSETTAGKMMAEVSSEWDSFKKWVGLSSDTPKSTDGGKDAGKPGEPNHVEVTNIYKSGETANAATTTAAGDGKPAAGETKSATASGDKSAPASAGDHWYSGIANWVDKGWDTLSDSMTNTYHSILNDSDNKTTHVEAHMGADGKPDYFQTTDNLGTRTLTADEIKIPDAKGGLTIKNTKTGEITSQSADGNEIYTHKADGTEIVRLKESNIEYTKNKDGTYEARDDKGNVTEIGDQGAITDIGHKFKVAQRLTTIDADTAPHQNGLLETHTDGQVYQNHQGDLFVHRANGINEITTATGEQYRIDRKNHSYAVKEDGEWKTITFADYKERRHVHTESDGHGGVTVVDAQGNKIDAKGNVETNDQVKMGAAGPDGKIVTTVPTDDGKPAVITTNPDHTSTLDLNGHLTKVNPDDPTHLVQRFKDNPDGSLGPQEFCYDSQDHTFTTPDFEWTPDGTYLGWNGDFVDTLGAIFDSYNKVVFDDSPDAETQAQTKTDDSLRGATSAVADVTSKVGSVSLDSGDLSVLNASLGELDGALNLAMSSGNFDAMCQIIKAKADVESAIAMASQQVNLTETMKGANMTEGDIVSAQSEVASRGVEGAAGAQEARVLGPDAQTWQGKLSYMQDFGISGLNDDQERRLSA